MRLNRVPLPLLFIFTMAALARAQDKTDEFAQAQLRRQRIPGMSVAVVKNGQIVKAQGYGVADRQTNTPARPDTVYKIASVSKQFIATGIMLLVQDGKIRVDDRISRYLDGSPEHWSGLTIRHLLTHTSGLVREAPGFDPMKVQSDADVIRTAYALPLRSTPGEKYEYGNVNYFILAEIIRKTSGKPWENYLDEKVFKPLGMNSTFPTNTRQRIPNLSAGYSDNDALRPAAEWAALRPSGAFYSTVLDLAKWDAALYTDKILTKATRDEMWAPVRLNDGTLSYYGYGWLLGRGARKLAFHTGGMPGFNSALARYYDDQVTVIVLMNLDDVDMDAVFLGLAELHLPNR
jgi:D-alanyl-D-alanine carboxypeptidase